MASEVAKSRAIDESKDLEMVDNASSPSSPHNTTSYGEEGYDSGALNLHEGANWISQILVLWLKPLLNLGYKRPLEGRDLPQLSSPFIAHKLCSQLATNWNTRKDETGEYRLLKACLDTFGGPFYWAGVLKLIGDIAALSSPLLLATIIADLKAGGQEIIWGISLCLLIFALQMINTLAVNAYFTMTMQTGLKIRTATSGLIYFKALRLSGKGRQNFSTGQIVNLMSTDGSRLDMATSYLHYVWSGLFQTIVILAMLFRLLKWAAFVGFGILIFFIPIQSKIMALLSRYRKQTSSITDQRVRLMQEIIQGIRVIKLYAWESCFLGKLFELRDKELSRVSRSQVIRSVTVVMTTFTSVFSCIITFLVYSWMGNQLTAEIVFPTLALFNLLRLPLILLPMVISMTVDGRVSAKRIQKFLLADELDFEPKFDPTLKEGILVTDGCFVWETISAETPVKSAGNLACNQPERPKSAMDPSSVANLLIPSPSPEPKGPLEPIPCSFSGLSKLNLTVQRGQLAAIVGPVGSGKSSLLSALIGELKCLGGEVKFGGTVAYCPQQAWIQNATVRDNILFGAPFDSIRYQEVVSACALLPDFAMLPDGDLTEIGEKGVNLSGGQKQRISLARAAYSDASIILLDDPLSAVDAHVGRHLLEHCIKGVMAGRTRVLVTHQLYILPLVDQVIVMEAGRLVEEGSFDELMQKNGDFNELMVQYGGMKDYNSGSNSRPTEPTVPTTMKKIADPQDNDLKMKEKAEGKITAAEERYVGAVGWSVYREYLWAAGGVLFLVTAIGSVIMWNVTRVSTDYWIASWTSAKPIINVSSNVFQAVYLGLGIMQGIFAASGALVFAWGGVKAVRILHYRSAERVLHAPVSFFDTNPTGRIINRFSKDLDTLDNLMPETLRSFVHTFGLTIFTYITMIIVDYYFTLPLILLLALYYFIQRFYRSSSREVKRLESLSRSPMYAQFGETLTGLPTVRAFGQQTRFAYRNQQLMDLNNRAAFVQLSIQRWLGVRLESVGNLIILAAAVSCYIFKVPPSLAGLTISYALGVTGTMNWCIRQFADTETQIISSERLGYYANKLIQEAPHDIPAVQQPLVAQNWPAHGAITFKQVTMKYRPELAPVLHGISVEIRGGERVGIVGRTGAGKSSIMQALFRIVETSGGHILIDEVDVASLGLEFLRCRISIIPQDPVVFAGTVRWNLDPRQQYSDQELWNALERAHLREAIQRLTGGLDGVIQEGGDNLSVGQRQLLCLARAILRNNRILVLDEATANIDLVTDSLIQQSIRRDFGNCTILTIAHRISTVIDYDRILVLEGGRVVEFDTPARLLANPQGHFSALVRETGEQNEAQLRASVEQKAPIIDD